MLWVPQKGLGGSARMSHNTGAVGVLPFGTAVTTGAASTTKGTVVELIASTSHESYWITVIASDYSLTATASEGCLDILIGAATEEVLIPDLLMGYCGNVGGATNTKGPKRWEFPLYVPAGSRIAARAAGIRLSTAMRVSVFLYGGPVPPWRYGTKVTTYGIGTVPNGTTIVPGASGAEGAWTQITASTSEDHFCLVPSFQPRADTTITNGTFAIDLGYGAATEEELAQSYWFCCDGAEAMDGPQNPMPCFVDIPSGSRLTMRASCNRAVDSGYGAAIHCVS